MADLPILARAPLPEPLTWVSPLFAHGGRRAVVLGASGTVWLMEIDPARRGVDLRPLPITVEKRGENDRRLRSLAGSHTLDRLLVWTDRMRVHTLPGGELIHERHGPPEGEGAACLTPDGRWLLCVEAERAWSAEVDAPGSLPHETWTFHQAEAPFEYPDDENAAADFVEPEPESVFLDHVDTLAVHPRSGAEDDGDGAFWLAAGCYGFVVTHLARAGGRGVDCRAAGKTRVFDALVYDPTELVRPFGAPHLFVLHGMRAGLAALDPQTGERHDCAVRGPKHPYGFFGDPAISADSPVAVVRCRDGAFLWEPGVRLEPLEGVPLETWKAWRVYGGELLCVAGGELVWVRLP